MLKRLLDLVISSLTLTLLTPILILLIFLVLIDLGRPIFFVQTRPGLKGKPFRMYKFRTMKNCNDQHGNPMDDKDRITRFGSFLRSTSMDELPELFNVIKGDMSLVGPRPLLMEYLSLYSHEQMKRHDTRPGITGWAQINGRNSISWKEKFNLDIWYVNNRNIWLDIKILFLTIFKILARDGISSEGHATMQPFRGKKDE